MSVPAVPEAERSVLGQMMRGGHDLTGEILGLRLRVQDFHEPANQILYEALYEAYYADEPLDPLSIGEACVVRLTKAWKCEKSEALAKVNEIAAGESFAGNAVDHAKLIREHADKRALLEVAESIKREVSLGDRPPEEIAGRTSESAMRIATSTLHSHEIVSFGDLGRRAIQRFHQTKNLKDDGVELGAKFGLKFLDEYVKGLQPTEMLIGAGEPGVGKSAVFWTAARKFAERQAKNPIDRQVAALVLSLEMDEHQTNMRLASAIAGLDGGRLREAMISEEEIQVITNEWGKRKDIPLYFNFTSTLRASELRALIVEAIRRHNVGLVVIDHFRHWHLDKRLSSPVQEDEEKAEFLAQQVAKELNVAVICVAHTTKGIEQMPDRRPHLTHLRGSYQVAAHADHVMFVYRPFKYAEESKRSSGDVRETDAEAIYRKNRHGFEGIVPFYADLARMQIE